MVEDERTGNPISPVILSVSETTVMTKKKTNKGAFTYTVRKYPPNISAT